MTTIINNLISSTTLFSKTITKTFIHLVSSALLFTGLCFSTASNAVPVTLSEYVIPDGKSWNYIFTNDTFGPDRLYTGTAGQEFTVTEQPFVGFLLDFFTPPPETEVDTGVIYEFEPNIYAYFELTSLTVREVPHDNVLRILWLDSNFTANPINQFGYTANDWGVTGVDWFSAGVGQIKDLGIGAGTGNIDGGYELMSHSVVPVPAAVWLFGSGLLGLIGVARRKKA